MLGAMDTAQNRIERRRPRPFRVEFTDDTSDRSRARFPPEDAAVWALFAVVLAEIAITSSEPA